MQKLLFYVITSDRDNNIQCVLHEKNERLNISQQQVETDADLSKIIRTWNDIHSEKYTIVSQKSTLSLLGAHFLLDTVYINHSSAGKDTA